MSATRMVEKAMDKVRAAAGVKTVYGEPIKVEDKTIIPIAKVAVGGKEQGVGAYAVPVGVVEVSGGETRFVPVAQAKKFAISAAIGSGIGLVLGWLLGRRGTRDHG